MEEPVGPLCRQEVQSGGARFSTTDGGRIVPAEEEEAGAGSEVSEWELRERHEREDERMAEAEALRAGEGLLFLPTPPFTAGEE